LTACRFVAALNIALVCTVFIVMAAGHAFAADTPTAEQERAIREEVFREDENGRPTVDPETVTDAFAADLYGRQNALGVLAKIFTEPAYARLNQKLGALRQTASLQIWADIAAETGLRIELNNAGKTNGALSDLDITFYADADAFPNDPDQEFADRGSLHDALSGMFVERWKGRFDGVDPENFDHMHIKGSDTMMDWRTSQAHWTDFTARLDSDIAGLSSQEGVYYIPGAYKPQVYGRYLTEGKAHIIEPDADATAHADGFPDGVTVRLSTTRDASLLYRKIPIEPDRTAQLEAILHNHQWAVRASQSVKHAKYSKRETDGLRDLTNLEVDFRRLILEGRDQALRHHLDKLFKDYEQKGLLPPEIDSIDEMERVIRNLHHIEIDKVLGASDKPRPKSWDARWRNYQAQNPNAVETKLDTYYVAEAEAIRERFPDLTDTELAERAEFEFREKARAISRLGAHKAATRLFTEVFTEDGLRQLRHRLQIKDTEMARRLVAERVRGLHAALVFQDDPRMLEAIRDAAPPEAREHVNRIVDIARAQRDAVLEHEPEVKRLTAGQLQESDEVIRKLLVRLGLGEVQARQGQIYRYWKLDEHNAWARQSRARWLKNSLLSGVDTLRTQPGEAYEYTKSDVRAYFTSLVEFDPATQSENFVRSFWDLGTVDAAAKVTARLAAGDVEGAKTEARDSILENVPFAGDMVKLLKAHQAWLKTGDWTPAAKLFGIKAMGSSYIQSKAWGPAASTLLGMGLAVYSIEKSLYDLGWYMAGKPTQNHALSIALMGDGGSLTAVYDCAGFSGGGFFEGIRSTFEGWKSSRFKPERISTREWEALSSAAILKNLVEVPPGMPWEVKELILKTQYMGPAIKEAFACGHGDNTNRTTLIAENYFREIYLRNADYWLRRAMFYDAVHLDFFAWNDRIHPGRNWHLLSEQPPLAGMTSQQQDYLKADMPDVYDQQMKLWDHERYWLRRYIREAIIIPWREKIPEVSEFIWQAETLTGDFEQALENELVLYYLEGERLDLKSDAIAKARTEAERRQADATIDENTDEIAKQVLAEQGKRQLEKQLLFEKLRWAPQLIEQFVDSLAQAVASTPEHQPRRPELQVVVHRPVARDGGSFPFRFFILGDVTLLPASLDEFTLDIAYEEAGQTLEERFPNGVNEYDVRWMFGRLGGPEGYDFTQYDATVSVKYEGPETFELKHTVPIWMASIHEEDEEDEPQPDPDPPGPEDDDVDDPADLADETEGKTANARQRCEEAAGRAAGIESDLEDAQARATAVAGEIDTLIGMIRVLQDVSDKSTQLAADAQAAAQAVVDAKQRAEGLALRICQAALDIKTTSLAANIATDLATIKTLQKDMVVNARTARDGSAQAAAAADELDRVASRAGDVQGRLNEAKRDLREVREAIAERRTRLDQLRAVADEAAAAGEEAAVARGQAAESLQAAGTQADQAAAEDAVGRISAVVEQLQNCATDLTTRADTAASGLDDAENAINETVARLLEAIRETPATLLAARIDEARAQSRSAADVAEVYAEAVEELRSHAATCGLAALDAANTRLVAEARARVRECDFRAAEAIITTIPRGPERTDLEQSLTETRTREDEVDALAASAASRLDQGGCPPPGVADDIGIALNKTVCDAKRTELSALLARAERATREAGDVGPALDRVRDLAARCEFDDALAALDVVDESVLCPEAVSELQAERAIIAAKKRKADQAADLIRQAETQAAAGNRDQAEATLVRARGLTRCPALLAAADDALSSLPSPEEPEQPDEPVVTARPDTPPPEAAPTSPPAEPGPDEELQTFYVAYKFYLYGPRGLSTRGMDAWPEWTQERPPEDATEQEKKAFYRAQLERFDAWVHSWTLADVEPVDMFSLSETNKIPGVFRIDPAAQNAFPRDAFSSGTLLSSPIRWSGSDPNSGMAINVQGGMIMEVIGVYDDTSRITADYPAFELKNIVAITDETGMFTIPPNEQGSGSGGPLAFGWSQKAKRDALDFSKSLWVMIYEMLGGLDCYLTSVVYGHAQAPSVQAFRRLRDDVMRATPWGRKLSGWYYAVGPGLARSALGHSAAHVLRPTLDVVAAWIEKDGHEHGADRLLLDGALLAAGLFLPSAPNGDAPDDPFSPDQLGLATGLATRGLPPLLRPIPAPSSTSPDSQ
jgi:hypothetical protein